MGGWARCPIWDAGIQFCEPPGSTLSGVESRLELETLVWNTGLLTRVLATSQCPLEWLQLIQLDEIFLCVCHCSDH